MERNRPRRNSFLRMALVGISVLLQAGWLLLVVLKLNRHFWWLSAVTSLLGALAVLHLYSKHTTSAMKMPWIMMMLVFPVMGLSLYLMLVLLGDVGNQKKYLDAAKAKIPVPQQELKLPLDASAGNIARYISRYARSPVYENTAVRYFSQGKDAFEAMKQDLEKAERFIFLEYFIVSDGSAFRELGEILERKAKAGVDVRLMYDDIGSIGYADFRFARGLNDRGIQCRVFNPAVPLLNLFMNHRDHRKIAVIDGKVAFTGGYNLSDEYFDRTHPYGHWKDTGIRLEGEAVRSLTAQFLELWQAATRQEEDCMPFLLEKHSVPASGFVQPFGDDPLGEERVAENVYLNLISRATKRLYITTPYLIITEEMNRALGLAAKRGVDVRIVTPGIPDKKTVYQVTRSYYGALLDQGVRIFEYSPGFLHAKQCLCDGDVACIGTSNLDYRSLYLHFENNVLLYGGEALAQMAADFEDLFHQCREVTLKSRKRRFLHTWQCLLRLFAPLM